MKSVVFAKAARKALLKMPATEASRIIGKIEQFADAPESLANNVRALKGRPGVLRLRVGDWRVLLVEGVVIDVIRIAPRGSAYE